MTLPVIQHANRGHARLSPSGSSRWIGCPGSVALEATMPPESGSNPAAEEGTRAHELLEAMLRKDQDAVDAAIAVAEAAGDDLNGLSEAVAVALDYIGVMPGQHYYETRVKLDAIGEVGKLMGGTADVIVWDEQMGELEVIDYKHGQGVVVEVEGNTQLLSYLLGAIIKIGVKPESMKYTIIQPRAFHEDGPIRSATIDWQGVVDFRNLLVTAGNATQEEDAPLNIGDHCRWCRAKAACPAQHTHALELAQTEFSTPSADPVLPPAPEGLTVDQLSTILERGKIVEDWITSVRDYAREYVNNGGEIPGYKLVEGRRSRGWRDPEATEKWLRQRFKVGQIFKQTLISPAQAETLLKTKPRLSIPDDFIAVKAGSPKLAPESSNKPALNRGEEFTTLPEAK